MLPGWNPQKLTQGSWPSNQGSRRQQRWLCLYQLCTASGHNRSLDCASPQGTTAVASKYRNSTREATCLEHHIFDGQMGGSPLLLLVKIKPSPQDHVSFDVPMRETSKLTSVTMSMVDDTGCQGTIIPLKSTYAMGIRKQDLVHVRLTMRGAIKEDLEVMWGHSRHRHQGHLWLNPINVAALLCLRQDGESLPLQRSTRNLGVI